MFCFAGAFNCSSQSHSILRPSPYPLAQLTERRRGNELYKARKFGQAMKHYSTALSIVEFVVAQNPLDQEEVEKNRVLCLLNIAAAHLALAEHGAAAKRCTEALALEPGNVKALLRRAKAFIGRAEYASARADLAAVRELDPWNEEAADEEARCARAEQAGRSADRSTFGGSLK